MRADARRNRHGLVAAARELLIERGPDFPLDAVSARAGVGAGTLYRHFRDRHELVVAVLALVEDGVAAASILATATLDQGDDEGWPTFVSAIVRLGVGSLMPALGATLPSDPLGSADTVPLRVRIGEHIEGVLAVASARALVREDIAAFELVVMLAKATRPISPLLDGDPSLERRLLAVLLAGLRPDGVALPGEPSFPADLPTAARAALRAHHRLPS